MNEVFVIIDMYFFPPFLLVAVAHLTDASAEPSVNHTLLSDLRLLSFESQLEYMYN